MLRYIAIIAYELIISNIKWLGHQMATVFLLWRHSLMCFLWRVVKFNSCIITEHRQTDNQQWLDYYDIHTQGQTGNISHLSISWVPLLYWGGRGLLLWLLWLLWLLCGDDEEASILKDFRRNLNGIKMKIEIILNAIKWYEMAISGDIKRNGLSWKRICFGQWLEGSESSNNLSGLHAKRLEKVILDAKDNWMVTRENKAPSSPTLPC